ncbi:MAG: hypothetical protein WC548_03570 [Candidatus Pacearchaeota archaeon]
MKFNTWYNKNHKKILVVPAIFLTLALIFLAAFYFQTGDIINKDVSLTGGSVFTISTDIPPSEMTNHLSKDFTDFTVNSISDNSGNQIQLIIAISESQAGDLKTSLENFLGHELNSENSSIETTSASLSKDFYRQLIISIILAFLWMSAIVFIIFTKGIKPKIWIIALNLLFGFFMGKFFYSLNPIISFIIFILFLAILIKIYIKKSVPAFAVMLCAFTDLILTLAVVDLIGMKLSTAGIVAFLMLIGYSVDTDILLTSRILNKKDNVNTAMFSAFKTGITMTLTSIIAIATALIIVFRLESVLNQIFIILIIGLCFDIFNTWVTNASIIKWYVEKK